MIPLVRMSAVAVLFGIAMTGPGLAQGLVMTHCKAEIETYCAGVPHGAGAVPVCLGKYTAKLSKDCRAALDRKGPGWGRMGKTDGKKTGRLITECKTEIAQYCADQPHDGTSVPACLEKHRRQLSHACKIVLAIKGGAKTGAGKPK